MKHEVVRLCAGALGASALAIALAQPDAKADETVAASSASASASSAVPTKPSVSPLSVRIQPIFGNEAAVGFGWQDFVVTIDNPSASAQKGTVELRSHMAAAPDRDSFVAKAPFAVTAGHSATVRLPMRARSDQVPTLTLRVVDDHKAEIVAMPVTPNMALQPTLIDIDNPSRLAIPLRGWPATVTYSMTPTYSYYAYAPAVTSAMTIAIATPTFDRTTGDPILPTRAASYSGITAVLVHSDQLARLEPEQKDALLDWITGGGTIAIVVARPEDLHGPELERLVGIGVVSAPVNPALASIRAVPKPIPAGGGGGGGTTGTFGGIRFDSDGLDESAFQFIRTSPPTIKPVTGLAAGVTDKLVGFSGGNLKPSNFGQSASYGRGEVHLLAFDPTESPMVDDVWVQSRMVDLINHAWDHRAAVVFPAGANPRNATIAYYGYGPGRTDEVRRALDPNENFRPALGFAAILLVLYSIFVGPVNFLRAKNRGKPLRPLLLAPIFSAAAFGAIVMVGLGIKGWRGRTRHLAFVETGSGATRAAITRFRGFYTSETRALSISASDRTSVLDVLSSDSIMDDKALVRVDRDGFSLENITSLPWQTLVVRENGFIDLKGGVTITSTASPGAASALTYTTEVKNDTGAALLDVLVYVPGDGIRWFETLKNGDKINPMTGKLVQSALSRRGTSAGSMTVHPFDPGTISGMLSSKDSEHLTKTWSPITTVAGDAIDWWPDDQIVVLGEVEGGERVKSDNGLSVESDRLLLRVASKQ